MNEKSDFDDEIVCLNCGHSEDLHRADQVCSGCYTQPDGEDIEIPCDCRDFEPATLTEYLAPAKDTKVD